jgi:signal transduction histidine kinase
LLSWALRLPVPVRLPLAAAAMIFFAAVASTQTAMFVMSRQADRQAETLGQVYLDGLSAALLPHVLRHDEAAIRATLRQALAFHQGVVDRRLAFVGQVNGLAVDVSRDDSEVVTSLPAELAQSGSGQLRTEDGLWIWRELDVGPTRLGTVAANLDVSGFESERAVLSGLLLLFDLGFSAACAVIGYFIVRRIQHPVTFLARHLYDAALGVPRPIDPGAMPTGDRQAERMFHAFNAMAHAAHERESLLSHLADQEREAVLGRLTATIAHEVRNPLGGMSTAIGTLKRFGDRADTRIQAVEFLERGVQALEQVVTATLDSHRTRSAWRRLTRQDFDDLRLLVDADGRSRDVVVVLDLELPEEVAVPALEVRQVLLNLLLNAVRASAKGSKVVVTACVQGTELVVGVRDEGPGMPAALARSLETGDVTEDTPGLGVAITIRLVERLRGRVAIESRPGIGTDISLHLPLRQDEATA